MSWQDYIDRLVPTFQHAAIVSLKDMGVWATSANFALDTNDITSIIENTVSEETSQAKGVTVGGKKQIHITKYGDIFTYKNGPDGVVICRLNTCFIVATHGSTIRSNDAIAYIENISNFLKEQNL